MRFYKVRRQYRGEGRRGHTDGMEHGVFTGREAAVLSRRNSYELCGADFGIRSAFFAFSAVKSIPGWRT